MVLARELGMTVSQLLHNTTSTELDEWRALYALESEERNKAARLEALDQRGKAKLQKR